MESSWSQILNLMGKTVDYTGEVVMTFNRGGLRHHDELSKQAKTTLTGIVRSKLPHPFEVTSGEIQKKHGLEWFRVRIHFVKGIAKEGRYELQTGGEGFTVTRFNDKGFRRRPERANGSRIII